MDDDRDDELTLDEAWGEAGAPSPAVPGESEERRAVVQGLSAPSWDPKRRPPGTIAWSEHEAAWEGYRRVFPGSAAIQDAQRIHERGGFGYYELIEFLGHEPTTWVASL